MNDIKRPGNIIELIKILKEQGIPEQKYNKYIQSFLESAAREKTIPITGSFELTPLCNLNCKMCYVHLAEQMFDKKILPVETWKEIIRQAIEAGMKRASLTGGECLTYPGFDEVYLYLHKNGISPGVLSNGILIDKTRIDFFKRYMPKSIQISLYGSSEDAYEKVTGKRVYHKVIENLYLLRESGIRVKIAITPNRFMAEDIYPLIERVEDLGIPYFINVGLISPRDNTGRSKEEMSTELYIELYKKRYNLDNLSPIDLADLPEENHGISRIKGLRCGAGRSGFVIKYDGSMSPCSSLGDFSVDTLKFGFTEAWKQINDIVNNYVLPSECEDCTYQKVCLQCAAMHKDAPKGHCDTNICVRTKKLVSAGILTLPEKHEIM